MINKLKPAFIITRREIRDQFRDWRLTIPIFILTMIFPAIMNFTADRMVRFVERFGAELIGERLIPFLLMIVGFFPVSVSLVIALESFVGEKERGSIEPLLSSPLLDWHLYFGKLFAVMIPPLIAAYLGMAVYLYGVYYNLNWVPELDLLILIVTLTFVQALVMVSGAVVISSQTTSVRAANLLASFIIIPVAFLIQGESVIMFWGQYSTLWWAVFGLTVVAWLLIRTGLSYFNREELLGRDMDTLNFKWILSEFINSFTGGARSVRQWYKLSIFPTLKELRLPFLIMAAVLVAGYYLGVDQASIFVIPPELIDLSNLDQGVVNGLDNISVLSSQRFASFILLQNLRAILIATAVGIFTYGVLGIMIIVLPFVLIGYFSVPIIAAGIPAWKLLLGAVAPHGVFEIPALLLAGALIYKLGARLAAPAGGKSISEGLLHGFADWTKIMVGIVIPLLLAAAAMEVFVTPRVAVLLLFQ